VFLGRFGLAGFSLFALGAFSRTAMSSWNAVGFVLMILKAGTRTGFGRLWRLSMRPWHDNIGRRVRVCLSGRGLCRGSSAAAHGVVQVLLQERAASLESPKDIFHLLFFNILQEARQLHQVFLFECVSMLEHLFVVCGVCHVCVRKHGQTSQGQHCHGGDNDSHGGARSVCRIALSLGKGKSRC
jgi:hypothetical protein